MTPELEALILKSDDMANMLKWFMDRIDQWRKEEPSGKWAMIYVESQSRIEAYTKARNNLIPNKSL